MFQNSGIGNTLYSCHFPEDDQTGYATGGTGTIIKTTDGGANWESQSSGTNTNNLFSVHFPVDAQTGYAVGLYGTILKTTDGGMAFVEEQKAVRPLDGLTVGRLRITPNPFASFARIPGHETERFALYDITGRKVGTYKGNRVGEGLAAGVYFLRTADKASKPLRIVKLR